MKIAIDLQGLQSNGSKTRGIGRYSKEIIFNLINANPENYYFLVSNGNLPEIESTFLNKLNTSNVYYFKWFSPSPFNYLSKDKKKIDIARALKTYAFNLLNADIILVTSFFEGFYENIITDFDFQNITTPIVSIFYDVIPLIYPHLYFEVNQDFAKYYFQKVNEIKQFDGLLAISKSSALEAISYLDFDQSKVFNISAACDTKLFNNNLDDKIQSNINFDSISPYILYSGASDTRKNVQGLIESYSKLSSEIKLKYKLVLAGNRTPHEVKLIDQWIKSFNIDSSQIVITGYVSDTDLALLYKNTSLFVFPSFHEGFGLPVLEAMSCGAPVIGSNNTSIREIIDNEYALFDPNNTDEIKDMIQSSLMDSNYKNLLINNGVKQKDRFSWELSGQLVYQSIQQIIGRNPDDNLCYDWSTLKKDHKAYFKKLVSTLSSLKPILEDQLINQISASIDLIDIEFNKSFRSLMPFDIKNISWSFEGPFDSNYSLAILNRCFVDAFLQINNKISIEITEGFGDYEPDLEFLSQYKNLFSNYMKSKEITNSAEITSRNLYPPRVNDMQSRINLIHSYGWEESKFPDEWVGDFNEYLQGISVMSKFVRKILIDNGVKIPIEITNLGINHIENIKSDETYKIKAKNFKILHVSSCFPRKGIDILISAYGNIFDINDDVTLLIKTFDNPHNKIEEILEDARDKNSLFPDVQIIKEDLNEFQMKSLYLQSNVLVAPSRGEGFGLPIAEAMILDIPVITTGWGGQIDFCNNANAWLIDYEFAHSKTHFNLDMSYWAEPSCSHLSYLIKAIFHSSSVELQKKTNLAKTQIKEYTWTRVANIHNSFANKLIFPTDLASSNIGCITTWNSRCGIASYSKNLFEYIQDKVMIFSPKNENSFKDTSELIHPSWDLDSTGSQNLDYVYNLILSASITTIIIQFNYGFFDFNQFSNLLLKLSKNNINIILIMHSTIDPIENNSKKLIEIASSLKTCSRILVHSIDDLNRLKKLGLIDNVCLFPHGIVHFETKKTSQIKNRFIKIFSQSFWGLKNRIIASYGFCLPNKGFEELIYAIHILKENNFYIKLKLFSAIYNDYHSDYFFKLKSLIEKLNINELVMINGDYMNDEDSLNLISNSDLIIFPYQNTNESSSASVRHGLATGRPVLVTPNPIFNNISSCVEYLPGFTPKHIADGLFNWYKSRKNIDNNKIIEDDVLRNEQINKKRFRNVSKLLINMIYSLEINK